MADAAVAVALAVTVLPVIAAPPPPPVLGAFHAAEGVVGARVTGKTRLVHRWILQARAKCAEDDASLLVIVVNPSETHTEYHDVADIVIRSVTCAFNGKPAYKFIAEWQRTRVARCCGAARVPCLLVIENSHDLATADQPMLTELKHAGVDVIVVAQTGAANTTCFGRVMTMQKSMWKTWPLLDAAVLSSSGITIGRECSPCGCASCAPVPAILGLRHFYADTEPAEAKQFADLMRFACGSTTAPPILSADAVRARVLAQT
jgi:hypothetical protein